MKKFMSIAAILVAMVSTVLFTSCGSDDSEVTGSGAAAEVVGTYTCNGTLTVMNQNSPVTAKVYKFEKKSDEAVNMTIPATGEGVMAFPDLPVEGVSATKNADGAYDLSLGELTKTISVNGADKTYTIKELTGTVKADGSITLAYNLKYGNMPQAMVMNLTGSKNK